MEEPHKRSSMSREAMQMALEALESDPISHAGLVSRKQAITALRQALVASQERVDEKAKREHEWVWLTDEPKALRLADALDAEFVQGRISNHNGRKAAVELRRLALKQWVGLTAYEIQEIHLKNPHWGNFACAIEAKLKEKNHG